MHPVPFIVSLWALLALAGEIHPTKSVHASLSNGAGRATDLGSRAQQLKKRVIPALNTTSFAPVSSTRSPTVFMDLINLNRGADFVLSYEIGNERFLDIEQLHHVRLGLGIQNFYPIHINFLYPGLPDSYGIEGLNNLSLSLAYNLCIVPDLCVHHLQQLFELNNIGVCIGLYDLCAIASLYFSRTGAVLSGSYVSLLQWLFESIFVERVFKFDDVALGLAIHLLSTKSDLHFGICVIFSDCHVCHLQRFPELYSDEYGKSGVEFDDGLLNLRAYWERSSGARGDPWSLSVAKGAEIWAKIGAATADTSPTLTTDKFLASYKDYFTVSEEMSTTVKGRGMEILSVFNTVKENGQVNLAHPLWADPPPTMLKRATRSLFTYELAFAPGVIVAVTSHRARDSIPPAQQVPWDVIAIELYKEFKGQGNPPTDLRFVMQFHINNALTKSVLQQLYTNSQMDLQAPDTEWTKWDPYAGSCEMTAVLALLGTDNGVGSGYALVDYHTTLGAKVIVGVYTRRQSTWWNMVFEYGYLPVFLAIDKMENKQAATPRHACYICTHRTALRRTCVHSLPRRSFHFKLLTTPSILSGASALDYWLSQPQTTFFCEGVLMQEWEDGYICGLQQQSASSTGDRIENQDSSCAELGGELEMMAQVTSVPYSVWMLRVQSRLADGIHRESGAKQEGDKKERKKERASSGTILEDIQAACRGGKAKRTGELEFEFEEN
ncbi:hypothetical protein K438DRAFT_1783445 [Mycena galopus ATCC 62051]|nr:hypothetical protein K438DRAFT_1783445 [Mycena galopus ATCC 62051]